ncbi:hypothetical protein [Dawidia soli]|uniref:Uncharacterized protein n=1 Tax=Dawidia soli TaxID=2782352 RepID=A0AAP2D4J4_9BACT|nr:hypothetical protein [Dawidia soli]MBT1685198.1 hypothetical protein [Dawidia soli]
MALLEGLTFTGTLGDFSAYRMRGSGKIVIRKKGGASKEQIRNAPNFATARLYMTEFGGCSRMGKHVRLSMIQLKGLANYNISGPINKIMKVIQKQDGVSHLGRRAIRLSKHPKLMEGFSLNQKYTLDSILRSPVSGVIDRETGRAHLEIPPLMREINFFPPNRHAMFRIEVTLGVAPDFTFNPQTGQYEAPAWYNNSFQPVIVHTPWYPSLDESPATALDVALKNLPPEADYSFVLSVGVRFGSLTEGGVIEEVKRDGAAKILLVQSGHASGNADSGKKGNAPTMENIPMSIATKQTSAHAEIAWGKESVLPPLANSHYAVPLAMDQPKKKRASRSSTRKPTVEKTPIYKERQEAPSGPYGYYCTMTLAAASRIVYVPA